MPEAQSSKVPAIGRTVRCPACGGESLFGLANAYRPFCSARCKGIDLGAWASERFRLSEGESSSAPDFEAG